VAGTTTYAGIARQVLDAPALLGSTRLVCIDGPAGSGKTTFATRLAAALGDCAVIHLDDLYEGWTGLDGVAPRVRDEVLVPVAASRRATYRTWDWHADRWGRCVDLDPPRVLVLEGCGSADRLLAAAASLAVWVEAPATLRLARGLARDGEAMRGQWLRWRQLEDCHFRREGTRARADLLVDGTQGDPESLHLLGAAPSR
jgi:hypothetical protein